MKELTTVDVHRGVVSEGAVTDAGLLLLSPGTILKLITRDHECAAISTAAVVLKQAVVDRQVGADYITSSTIPAVTQQ